MQHGRVEKALEWLRENESLDGEESESSLAWNGSIKSPEEAMEMIQEAHLQFKQQSQIVSC
jgi:hypothetical protein